MSDREELRQQNLAMIADWQGSGLSQKQYCAAHNIAYHKFHYWYTRSHRRGADKGDGSSLFVNLTTPSLTTGIHAELQFPDGKRLLFHQPVSSSYLKTLID